MAENINQIKIQMDTLKQKLAIKKASRSESGKAS